MIILSENISESDIQKAANNVINEVLDGNVDPVKTYVQLKAIMSACKQAIEGIEAEAIDKSYNYAGKSFTMLGANVAKKEGSLLLDYEQDAVYVKLKKAVKEREGQLKQAYDMNKRSDVYVTGDGEQVPIVPPRPTKPTLAITFKAE